MEKHLLLCSGRPVHTRENPSLADIASQSTDLALIPRACPKMADTTDVELLDYEEEGDQDMLDAQQHQKVDEEMEMDCDNNRKLAHT